MDVVQCHVDIVRAHFDLVINMQQLFYIDNYTLVKVRLFCLLYCSLNLTYFFYESATKLPLVG